MASITYYYVEYIHMVKTHSSLPFIIQMVGQVYTIYVYMYVPMVQAVLET